MGGPVFGGGQEAAQQVPLVVGEVGVVGSDFHRRTGATANESHKNSQSNQAFCAFFLQPRYFKNIGISFSNQLLTMYPHVSISGLVCNGSLSAARLEASCQAWTVLPRVGISGGPSIPNPEKPRQSQSKRHAYAGHAAGSQALV